MAEPLAALAGPVSETMAAPLGAKATEKVPGAGLGLTTMGERVPSGWTWKTSMLLATRSVTTRNWPSGLKASEAPPAVVLVGKAVEFVIGSLRAPLSRW